MNSCEHWLFVKVFWMLAYRFESDDLGTKFNFIGDIILLD